MIIKIGTTLKGMSAIELLLDSKPYMSTTKYFAVSESYESLKLSCNRIVSCLIVTNHCERVMAITVLHKQILYRTTCPMLACLIALHCRDVFQAYIAYDLQPDNRRPPTPIAPITIPA